MIGQKTIINLFQDNALNGMENRGITCDHRHCIPCAWLWPILDQFVQKISNNHAAKVLKNVGIANILFTFLIATPLHDMMVIISSTLSMLGVFYITVFTLKTMLHPIKICCILSMLLFCCTLFLYGFGDWGLLATMQKVAFTVSMLLVPLLECFTKQAECAQISPREQSLNATKRLNRFYQI